MLKSSCPLCFVKHRSKKEAEKCYNKVYNERNLIMSRNENPKKISSKESRYIRMYIYLKENFG